MLSNFALQKQKNILGNSRKAWGNCYKHGETATKGKLRKRNCTGGEQEKTKGKKTKTMKLRTTVKSAALALALVLAAAHAAMAQTAAEWKKLKGDVTMYMANDLGRNGYYDQKPIAQLMGRMAETLKPKCVLAAGDVHHFYGVQSVTDPLWMTNYELIYAHPELMIPWYPILGNHEYRGNTQAVLDYAKVSRRWMMPARYYTKVLEGKGTTVRVVFIDTTPFIERYRDTPDTYPDACRQDTTAQLQWLDATLKAAHEDWVIVVGHHPIYAQTEKGMVEQENMRSRVQPVLRRYRNVDIYACGHIHDFQHIRAKGDDIDYVVNSAGALSRDVKPMEGTVFCSGKDGFSVISATRKRLCLYMIDKEGNVIHTVTRNRK